SPGEGTPDPDQLKAGLARELPAIMVPSDIVVVADIPLTPNGKLDRKRLLEVHRAAPVVTRAHMGTASERAIAAVWAEALGLGEVPIDGNFFDLGGHSLLVVQVRRLINQSLAVDLSITDLFRYPTVRALAAHLETPGARGPTASDRGSARATARRRRMGRR
ncbi:MAG: phosphopantetheine-binding protein, partial [Pseudomonadota bacterium]